MLRLYLLIALACESFQPMSVEDRNLTATVSDEMLDSKAVRNQLDTLTTQAEHFGHELVRHEERLMLGAIVHQPSGTPLRNRMQAIAARGLNELDQKARPIGQHEPHQLRLFGGLVLKTPGLTW